MLSQGSPGGAFGILGGGEPWRRSPQTFIDWRDHRSAGPRTSAATGSSMPLVAPLLGGVINRLTAILQSRPRPSVLQPYCDLWDRPRDVAVAAALSDTGVAG
jgi:hypothetical protein